MQKNNIELIRDGKPQALLSWHKPDGEGGFIPLAVEFSETLDAETRQRVTNVCDRPVSVRKDGKVVGKAFPGSSKHFIAIQKVLGRLGFRIRIF